MHQPPAWRREQTTAPFVASMWAMPLCLDVGPSAAYPSAPPVREKWEKFKSGVGLAAAAEGG
eukprot:3616495-Amphidinium_carterae.2